ncbi:hypothetical protein JCM3774_001267 [Rhodotorula dairenensis]
MQHETIILSDSATSTTEPDSSDVEIGKELPSARPPAHYHPPRNAPHEIPAARKSAFQRSVNQNASRQRQKATATVAAAAIAGAGSRKSRLKQPLVKKEEDLPAPSWPTSPAKTSQPPRAESPSLVKTESPLGVSYPFSLQLRLEEVRLGSDYAASRPTVELAVAFRDVDQSTRSASVAASTAFQVDSSAARALDDGSILIGPDDLPQDLELPVVRKPPRSAVTTGTPPDLRDVGILATISPSREGPAYSGWLSLVAGGNLQQAGRSWTRRAADGTQVTLRWQADSPNAAESVEPLAEEGDVARFLEDELRAAEADWRRETAKRAQLLAELEAQSPPAYGPPAQLVAVRNAPSPASLIPGLNSQGPVVAAATVPTFPPIPRYSYTRFASRAVPVAGHQLESFPCISDWEDAAAANELVAEKSKSFLPSETDEGPIPTADSHESDWLRDGLVDLHSFQTADNGRTVRDHRTLRKLLERLDSDSRRAPGEAELDAEKRAAALELFRRRVGRSAQEVAQAHRLISAEELFPADDAIDWCAWCGAIACTVHACFVAYNRPQKTLARNVSPEADVCGRCGEAECLMNARLDRMHLDNEVPELPERLKGLDPCTLSLILGRVSENVPAPQASASSSPPARQRSNWWKKNVILPCDSYGYVPCRCVGACYDDCPCVQSSTYCDEYCNCPTSCPRRFKGCSDGRCDSDSRCACRERGRECNPRICGCTHSACKNSRVRLGQYKATCIVRSQIPGAGYGLAMLESAARHDLLGVYGGELFPKDAPQFLQDVTMDNTAGSWRAHMADAHPVSYWFEVDNADAVDSVELGGTTRFINHDLGLANVEARVINIAGTHQVAIYATKPLQAGDELFMDYGSTYYSTPSGA